MTAIATLVPQTQFAARLVRAVRTRPKSAVMLLKFVMECVAAQTRPVWTVLAVTMTTSVVICVAALVHGEENAKMVFATKIHLPKASQGPSQVSSIHSFLTIAIVVVALVIAAIVGFLIWFIFLKKKKAKVEVESTPPAYPGAVVDGQIVAN